MILGITKSRLRNGPLWVNIYESRSKSSHRVGYAHSSVETANKALVTTSLRHRPLYRIKVTPKVPS